MMRPALCAFAFAITVPNRGVVEPLLRQGLKTTWSASDRFTPLAWTSTRANTEVAAMLLKAELEV